MKTAIEKLLEWMETDLPRIKEKLDTRDGEPIIIGRLLYFLEIEKQQIIDAYSKGQYNSLLAINGETYYLMEYNQNQPI